MRPTSSAAAAQRQAAARVRRRLSDLARPSKAQVLALYDGSARSAGRQVARTRSARILKRTSYRDYLIKICGCSEEVANCFQGRTLGFFGLGSDAVPAADARELGYPGFAGLGLPGERQRRRGASPTSIISPTAMRRSRGCWCARSFPASRRAARWTTSCWRRSTTRGSTAPSSRVRIRLDSTCIDVRNAGDGRAELAYVRDGDGASRRGAARGARLLPHDDPVHHAGAAGGAARGAGAATSRRRSSTPRCWCATGAPWAKLRRARDLRADVVPSAA